MYFLKVHREHCLILTMELIPLSLLRTLSAVELAREQVCGLIGCRQRELIFTSGATEANNLALRGLLATRDTERRPRKTILTTALEHSAIREPCEQLEREGYRIVHLPIDASGVVELEAARSLFAEHGEDVALASVHWANNETGVIQPIAELAALARAQRVPMHSDATQAVGKLPVDVGEAGLDAMSFSGHKFHGPKGIGGLYVRTAVRLMPQVYGGPQERQRRGGTEHVPGILGLGVAAERAGAWLGSDGPAAVRSRRDRFERAVLEAVPDAVVNAGEGPRLDNTSNLGFPPLEAEAVLLLLSERGVCASAGAACSSGSLEPSPILLAMQVPEPVAHGSVRFSLSRQTTDAEIDAAIETVPQVIEKLRTSMPTG